MKLSKFIIMTLVFAGAICLASGIVGTSVFGTEAAAEKSCGGCN